MKKVCVAVEDESFCGSFLFSSRAVSVNDVHSVGDVASFAPVLSVGLAHPAGSGMYVYGPVAAGDAGTVPPIRVLEVGSRRDFELSPVANSLAVRHAGLSMPSVEAVARIGYPPVLV